MRAQTPLAACLIASTAAMALLVACANIAPPPGGEPDLKGPTLLSSSPVSGSTDVPRSDKIEIAFSEHIVEPLEKNAVFVSPRPSKRPRVKWHAKSVEIQLPDSFQANQTYTVSLSSSITDLRGNKLDSAANVAFSTGPTLDSGHITGTVYQDGKPFGGALVALFRGGASSEQVRYDSTYPDYIATSNTKGFFSLQHLPPEEYRLLSFIDNNKDERYNPSREPFAVPDRPVRLQDGSMDDIRLDLTPFDTAAPKVVSVAYTPDRLLRLRLSRPIPFRELNQNPGLAFLWQVPDSANSFRASAFLESGDESGSILSFSFGDVPDTIYALAISYLQGVAPVTADSIKVVIAKDKNPPTISRHYPQQTPVALKDLKLGLCFSEPLDTSYLSERAFSLLAAGDSAISLTSRWGDPLHLDFKTAPLSSGSSYRLQVAEFEIIDKAGNAMGDSVVTYSFVITSPDSLGSVSGGFVYKPNSGIAEGPVQLTLTHLATQNKYNFHITDRTFRLDLPAGRYLASAYIDANRDGMRSYGSPIPYTLAETRTDFPDTIAVRARFETAEVKLVFK